MTFAGLQVYQTCELVKVKDSLSLVNLQLLLKKQGQYTIDLLLPQSITNALFCPGTEL